LKMARTKVLVVDDSPSVRQQVGMALSLAGFDIVEAVDGLDGAQKIETVAGLSLVVCDVNMPRLNGIEMVEKVKAGGKNAALPIMMLTTEAAPALMQRAKAAGAKAWIIKPFKAEILVSAAKALTKAAA